MKDLPTSDWCERSACNTGVRATFVHRDNRKRYCNVCARKINEMNGEELCREPVDANAAQVYAADRQVSAILDKYNDSALVNAMDAAGLSLEQKLEFIKEFNKWE